MTRSELAEFWNAQLGLWFHGHRLSSHLQQWRQAYQGELQEWAFPEPFIGDLLGSPRIVLLANNPGVAHEELQSREGIFANQITAQGFTSWAATRPFEGPESEWEKRYGPIRHNRERLHFARRFLNDQRVEFADLLNFELYPWHSPQLTHSIRVRPDTLREFVLEPLREFGEEVPVVALGKAWADALDRTPQLIRACDRFDGFRVPSRRARRYTTHDGGRLLVVWHTGSDKPPAADDTERLHDIWFRSQKGGLSVTTSAARSHRPSHQQSASSSTTGDHSSKPRGAGSPVRASSGRRVRFDSADALAATVENEIVRGLIYSLPEWIAQKFHGNAVADRRPTGQFRLRILGEAADIGWDFKQRWIWVWVNKPLPGDRATLESALSSSLGNLAPPKLSFRVQSDSDVQALQALISRHVDARRR